MHPKVGDVVVYRYVGNGDFFHSAYDCVVTRLHPWNKDEVEVWGWFRGNKVDCAWDESECYMPTPNEDWAWEHHPNPDKVRAECVLHILKMEARRGSGG